MADEPMTDERLAEIRQRMHEIDTYLRQSLIQPRMPGVPVDGVLYNGASDAVDAATALLAEVDRLRAREAAAMAIVREVANTPRRYTDGTHDWALVPVDFVEQASALLAQE